MPLGRNCVTALPAAVHRSGRQCTGRCSNSRYLSTHHPHVRVGRPSWYVRYQCSTCVCDDQRSANLPTSRSTQNIWGLQGHWPNRRLVGIGNRTIQQNPTWAGGTLSVVASGTTPAPVPVALAGALGAAAAASVAVGAGGPEAPEVGTGNEGAAAAVQVVHIRMAPRQERGCLLPWRERPHLACLTGLSFAERGRWPAGLGRRSPSLHLQGGPWAVRYARLLLEEELRRFPKISFINSYGLN